MIKRTVNEKTMYLHLFLTGAVLLIIASILLTVYDKKKLSVEIERNLSFVEKRIAKYEYYTVNDKTKSLVRLLDKTQELSRCLAVEGELLQNNQQVEDFLEQYAYEQHITGTFVVDEQLQYLYGTPKVDFDDKWKTVVESTVVSDIITYPKKCYLTRMKIDGDTYDLAVVSCRDRQGLVVTYEKKEQILDRDNEITIDTMLTGFTFPMDGAVVVTDEDTILTSNTEKLQEQIVTESKRALEEEKESEDYLEFLMDGKKWYGCVDKTGVYQIYLFFPADAVFEFRDSVLGYGIFVYVLVCMAILAVRYQVTRSNMSYIQKQYNTIRSISAIYEFGVLIDFEKNNWEKLRMSPEVETYLQETMTADKMLVSLQEYEIAPEYQAIFREFINLDRLKVRLQDEKYITCSVENTYGDWDFFIIAPHNYDSSGELHSILLLGRDMTDEKRREMDYQRKLYKAAEQERRANVAKTDFLRRMSHDVRTPINGIMGMVEISRHYRGNEEKQEECRSKILEASGFLLDLVNNVLDMNKLESGEVRLEQKPFDFYQLYEAVRSVAEIESRERGIMFSSDRVDVPHKNLIGSPLHLRQILQNITSNAIKYNRDGGSVRVSVEETAYEDDVATLEFICADTGIGMSEEFQKKAFEVFAQENSSARTAYAGTGLGLSIARELVEQMGGTISFVSKVGEGTTFTIRIPFKVNTSVSKTDDKNIQEGRSLEGMHILVAEDNELNMEIVRFVLENEGIIVVEARNGKEAVDLFCGSAPGTFDLILMDVMMPVMNGIEAAKSIRTSVRPDAGTIPIFAMTANAFSDDVQRSTDAQMNEHISKPIDTRALLRLIATYRG